jgi:hypothetical protein
MYIISRKLFHKEKYIHFVYILQTWNIYQSFVQLVSEQCREHVTMLSALYRANTLSLIFVNSPQEDMSFYSDTSFWFRTNQSLYFFLNAVSNANFKKIDIYF